MKAVCCAGLHSKGAYELLKARERQTLIGGKTMRMLTIREAKGEPFRCSSDVYEMMKEEAKADRECCWVLHINGQNKVIEKELVSMGTVDHSMVHPREVFRKALIMGASSIIVVHNHPSGEATQSEADIQCSKKLNNAADVLGIRLLDFIIIATEGFKSFGDENIGGFV